MANFQWKDSATLKLEREAAALETLRNNRNRELRETDYMLLPDAPIDATQLQEVTAYRQGLRALTDNVATAPDYAIDTAYTAGDVFIYSGDAYAVIQGHTSQLDWLPNENPALYRYLGEAESLRTNPIPEWVQPTGAHDAYNIGDQVLFGGSIYESTIDANTWSPTEYPQGWTLV